MYVATRQKQFKSAAVCCKRNTRLSPHPSMWAVSLPPPTRALPGSETFANTPQLKLKEIRTRVAVVEVPPEAVSKLKGHGGSSIEKLQGRTGATIKLDKEGGENAMVRVNIYGDAPAIAAATREVCYMLFSTYVSRSDKCRSDLPERELLGRRAP